MLNPDPRIKGRPTPSSGTFKRAEYITFDSTSILSEQKISCTDLVASKYGRGSGGPVFESRDEPSLVIRFSYQEILSKQSEIGKLAVFHAMPRRAR
ncbi:unnamed protein product, partial [Brenthis ino]